MTDGIIQQTFKKYQLRNCTDVIIQNELFQLQQELIEKIKLESYTTSIYNISIITTKKLIGDSQE